MAVRAAVSVRTEAERRWWCESGSRVMVLVRAAVTVRLRAAARAAVVIPVVMVAVHGCGGDVRVRTMEVPVERRGRPPHL